jgi:hypothetical protein
MIGRLRFKKTIKKIDLWVSTSAAVRIAKIRFGTKPQTSDLQALANDKSIPHRELTIAAMRFTNKEIISVIKEKSGEPQIVKALIRGMKSISYESIVGLKSAITGEFHPKYTLEIYNSCSYFYKGAFKSKIKSSNNQIAINKLNIFIGLQRFCAGKRRKPPVLGVITPKDFSSVLSNIKPVLPPHKQTGLTDKLVEYIKDGTTKTQDDMKELQKEMFSLITDPTCKTKLVTALQEESFELISSASVQ